MTAAVHNVVADHDTRGARTVGRSNNPAAGILAAQVPPGRPKLYELGQELLRALGKNPSVTGTGRHEIEDWQLLPAWLLAQGIGHVILTDAQWLSPSHVDDLCGLAATSGIELWLVAHRPLPDSYTDSLKRWPVKETRPDELVAVVTEGLTPVPAADVRAFPAVPTDNFPTFRAAARRHLDDSAFAVVDARFVAAYDQAAAWFEANTPSEAGLCQFLRDQLHACVTSDEMLVVVRAAQVAAFRAGWLVNAELTQLIATAEHASAAAVHSPETWRRLAAYREPYRGAACALAAAEVSIDEMLTVTCADVDHDGSGVRLHRDDQVEHVLVPEGAAVYLRAQLAWRAIQGALAGELLFAEEDKPMRDRHLSYALRAPIVDLGIPLLSQRAEKVRTDALRWSKRWGLSIQELA